MYCQTGRIAAAVTFILAQHGFKAMAIYLWVSINEHIALITGVTGQDGAYLVELLLKKGYVIHGKPTKTFCAESRG